MASESPRDRRERLDAIKARVRSTQHTPDDVSWLVGIAEEYIANWEQSLARLRRRATNARSTAWPATSPDLAEARRRNRRRPGSS